MRYTPLLLLLPLAALGQQEPARVFRAGAATSNITPPLGAPIVGGWQPIPATNIHDELHARCLVLDDGRTRLAIVVSDSVGIPRPGWRSQTADSGEERTAAPEHADVGHAHTFSRKFTRRAHTGQDRAAR
jgi:hypothetical protein